MYKPQKIILIRYQEGKHGQCSEAFLGQQIWYKLMEFVHIQDSPQTLRNNLSSRTTLLLPNQSPVKLAFQNTSQKSMSDKLIFVVSYYELIFDQGNYALD